MTISRNVTMTSDMKAKTEVCATGYEQESNSCKHGSGSYGPINGGEYSAQLSD
jgi:hypothetical protein